MGISPAASMMRANVTAGLSHVNATTEALPRFSTRAAERVTRSPPRSSVRRNAPSFHRLELPTKHIHEQPSVEAKFCA